MLHAVAHVAAPELPDRATLEDFPDGEAGTRAVLRRMREIVREAKKHPLIRAQAVAIVQRVPAKNWPAEAAAVQDWVRQHIRYTRDVLGVETLQTPAYLLRVRAGDCDDHSMLVAALLESIGHPTRFVAIGARPGVYSHVFCETRLGYQWRALETTAPLPFGRAPSLRYRLTVHNG